MIRMLVVAVAVSGLLITGCSQEQPAPAQPKPAAKPAVEPATPATPIAPAAPTPPVVAPEPAKPAVPPAATPKVVEPVPAPAKPAKPAEPAAPVAPAKPAVKIPAVPDTLTLAASQGKVTLSHLVHAKLFPCASCHGDGTPGKIDLNKETAHALCRDCHKAKGAGPTACGDCHKK